MPWLIRILFARFGMRFLGWAWRKFQARNNAAPGPPYRRDAPRRMF